MFDRATRMKLRFATEKGNITTEDVWELPLIGDNDMSLDAIAKRVSKEIKEGDEESFVEAAKPNPEMIKNKLRLDIIKHIIKVKLDEKESAKKRADRKERKEKLLRAIAAKQDESLQQASLEELQAMVDELDE
ncbi:MAG: hypothetical protein GF411_02900 [Candidatus Lokiarchaeota archaeon]|nr:hypothetical protein [Candidatus Lokiarchaeota archaeon]